MTGLGLKNRMVYLAASMNKSRKIFSIPQLASAIVMVLALMWLTVSMPFVLASQQQQAKINKTEKTSSPINSDEEATNPFGNNTEEKAPNTANNFSEEYLHSFHIISHNYTEITQYHKHENAGIYIAFHGELLVPPPNAA